MADSGRFDWSAVRVPLAEPSGAYHGLRFFDTFGHYAYLMKLRVETMRDIGASASPFNSFLLLAGIGDALLRMDRHVANALAVAALPRIAPEVAWVRYAGLPSSPYHALAARYLPKGPGAVFSFGLRATSGEERAAGKAFIEACELVLAPRQRRRRAEPRHPPGEHDAPAALRRRTRRRGRRPRDGAPVVGLETLDDLLWDLDQALAHVV